jgi:hypothetical protein
LGNGQEQKLLDKKFIVLNKNVLFRSRILFQKRIYSIFFGTKAAKRKLPILKERWFDIAKRHVEKDNDRHGPRRIPKYSQPLDLPNFSLPSTFKAITYSTLQ